MNPHPHLEVITAYYSGQQIEWRVNEAEDWKTLPFWTDDFFTPAFYATKQYRIKPAERLVRWVVVDGDSDNWCFDTLEEAEENVDERRHQNSRLRIVRMVEQPE